MATNLGQIQGNIFPGFRHKFQSFQFFRIDSVACLRRLGTLLTNRLTSGSMLIDRKTFGPAVNVAVSFRLLSLFSDDSEKFDDDAFRSGMYQRAHLLGDEDPENWAFGTPTVPSDLVVIIGDDDPANLALPLKDIEDICGLVPVFSQDCAQLPDDKEHFGFKDNISQPQLSGLSHLLNKDPESEIDEIQVGEFVFGYPKEADKSHSIGTEKPAFPAWAMNGSYCAIRRLRQRVGRFHSFVSREAVRRNIDPLQLASQIVGRYPNGTKVSRSANLENPRTPTTHIEKMNPKDVRSRQGLDIPNDLDNRKHRILRRGVPFGPKSSSTFDTPVEDDVDRGLMFVCYQSSIMNQFEFVQKRWANEVNFPRGNGGMDAIIGQAHSGELRMLRLGNEPQMIMTGEKWVLMTGGDYFFSPSMDTWKMFLE